MVDVEEHQRSGSGGVPPWAGAAFAAAPSALAFSWVKCTATVLRVNGTKVMPMPRLISTMNGRMSVA